MARSWAKQGRRRRAPRPKGFTKMSYRGGRIVDYGNSSIANACVRALRREGHQASSSGGLVISTTVSRGEIREICGKP